MRIQRLCEAAAAITLLFMVLVATGVAASRYLFAFTPVWAEAVMTTSLLLSVAFAVGPGLHDGIHVAIRFATDRLSVSGRHLVARVVTWLTLGLGLAFLVSGSLYTLELWTLGVTDYAGIPQWVQAALAAVFGAMLTLFSALGLRR
jgi:TRAP-type C4-dicarboxylate transport system permease small subunit